MDNSEKLANIIVYGVLGIIIIILGIWIENNHTKTGTFELQSEEIAEVEPTYHLFRIDVQEEYLSFLAEFDESQYTIVGISNSMNVESYGSDEFYMVTYRDRTLGDPFLISGLRIKIFLTDKENDFYKFLESLGEEQKIIDVSTSMNLGFYGSDEFYIVTYGEKIE